MSEVRGIYTLWKREVLRFLRERTRLVSSVVTPDPMADHLRHGPGPFTGAQHRL